MTTCILTCFIDSIGEEPDDNEIDNRTEKPVNVDVEEVLEEPAFL